MKNKFRLKYYIKIFNIKFLPFFLLATHCWTNLVITKSKGLLYNDFFKRKKTGSSNKKLVIGYLINNKKGIFFKFILLFI